MSSAQTLDRFERDAHTYDQLVPKLVPHYHEQNELIIKLIPFGREAPMAALDLGCGTGVLACLILKEFPRARVVAFDFAENMLSACREKAGAFSDRLVLRRGDFAEGEFGSGYDVVVSGLAVHHLGDAAKQRLFGRIFRAMRPGGVFLLRDAVAAPTPAITKMYEDLWRAFVRSGGEDDEHWCARARQNDNPSTAEDQMRWLAETGFVEVACHWRYLSFAILGARKP